MTKLIRSSVEGLANKEKNPYQAAHASILEAFHDALPSLRELISKSPGWLSGIYDKLSSIHIHKIATGDFVEVSSLL